MKVLKKFDRGLFGSFISGCTHTPLHTSFCAFYSGLDLGRRLAFFRVDLGYLVSKSYKVFFGPQIVRRSYQVMHLYMS